MAEHLKAIPNGDKLIFEMDRAGFELFHRLLSRVEPKPGDNPASFTAARERVGGAFYAGKHLMGWK